MKNLSSSSKKNKAKKKRKKGDAWLDDLNHETMELGMNKFILSSGVAPGLAEDIKMGRRYEPRKR